MKRILFRTKSDSFWCSLYLHLIAPRVLNLALIVNKSKRASNDWCESRNNKRRRRALKEQKKKTLKQLRACYVLVAKAIFRAPNDHHILIKNDFKKAQNLSKYVERLGFDCIPQDGQLFWVLTAQRRQAMLHHFERTTWTNMQTDALELNTAYAQSQKSQEAAPYLTSSHPSTPVDVENSVRVLSTQDST